MKIAIVGFDTEGRSTYEYFSKHGDHEFTICDQKAILDTPEGVPTQLGEKYLENLGRFDLIVRTAGLHPKKIIEENPGVEDKITTHVNEFLKACPTSNTFGVTGTKGKGTTSTLLTEMLKADGKDAYLGGNIGLPPLTFIDKLTPESWVVLELSSFQLIDIQKSPHIAVCLMVVPEHLDWHKDVEEYFDAKAQLFKMQKPSDVAIFYGKNENSKKIVSASPARKIAYYLLPGAVVEDNQVKIDGKEVCKTSEVKLLGEHNLQNVCAALTAYWQVSQNIEAARQVITTFTGLPHRLEFVRELNGVKYYNDSFGTVLESSIAAMQSIKGPKIMIVGGYDRYIDVSHFAKFVNQNSRDLQVESLILIGLTADKLQNALEAESFKAFINLGEIKDMRMIVEQAAQSAKSGQSVVLSPGFASFDMFKNFTDRGDQFRQAVNGL